MPPFHTELIYSFCRRKKDLLYCLLGDDTTYFVGIFWHFSKVSEIFYQTSLDHIQKVVCFIVSPVRTLHVKDLCTLAYWIPQKTLIYISFFSVFMPSESTASWRTKDKDNINFGFIYRISFFSLGNKHNLKVHLFLIACIWKEFCFF
jgi:hypothetical protein